MEFLLLVCGTGVFQDDFEVMNRFTSWEAVEKRNSVVLKFIRNGETAGLPLLEGEVLENRDDVFVTGNIMMVNNVVKLNMGGSMRVIDLFEIQEGRLEALKKWFPIYFAKPRARCMDIFTSMYQHIV